jgi:hypothetical protein
MKELRLREAKTTLSAVVDAAERGDVNDAAFPEARGGIREHEQSFLPAKVRASVLTPDRL